MENEGPSASALNEALTAWRFDPACRYTLYHENGVEIDLLRAGRPQDDYDISEMIKCGVVTETNVRSRTTDEQFARFLSLRLRSQD